MKRKILIVSIILIAVILIVAIGLSRCGKTHQKDGQEENQEKMYTVTFVQNGQSNVVREVEEGGTLTDIPEPQKRTGYTVAWEEKDLSNITRNIVVNAIETPNEYTVTYVTEEGTLERNKQTVTYDAAYELATPAAPDMYTFAYWAQEDGTAIMQTGCWKIAADVTLTAKWSKPYTITFVQTGQRPITRQVPAGGTLTDIPEPVAKTGYTVVWEEKEYTNITKSFTVNAVESANVYKIHYDLGALSKMENISGYIATQDVTFNESYNLISPSCNGYSFIKWVLKDSKTEFKNGIYTMTQDVYLTALWEIPEDSDGAWMKKQY